MENTSKNSKNSNTSKNSSTSKNSNTSKNSSTSKNSNTSKNSSIKKERSKKNSSNFFENCDCEYYPCHVKLAVINCLFCFCPLYHQHDCGGDYFVTKKGNKSCEKCARPHIPENYDLIMDRLKGKNIK